MMIGVTISCFKDNKNSIIVLPWLLFCYDLHPFEGLLTTLFVMCPRSSFIDIANSFAIMCLYGTPSLHAYRPLLVIWRVNLLFSLLNSVSFITNVPPTSCTWMFLFIVGSRFLHNHILTSPLIDYDDYPWHMYIYNYLCATNSYLLICIYAKLCLVMCRTQRTPWVVPLIAYWLISQLWSLIISGLCQQVMAVNHRTIANLTSKWPFFVVWTVDSHFNIMLAIQPSYIISRNKPLR